MKAAEAIPATSPEKQRFEDYAHLAEQVLQGRPLREETKGLHCLAKALKMSGIAREAKTHLLRYAGDQAMMKRPKYSPAKEWLEPG